MSQVFIFGASYAYGVGSVEGSFGDMIKRKLHEEMYSDSGIGEKHEVYSFAKPGATIGFVLDNYENQIDLYKKSGKLIAIVLVGANNAKATDTPENWVSTPEEFKILAEKLVSSLAEKVDSVICVELAPVDENKTTPKGTSYFYNRRLVEFNQIYKEVCARMEIPFIETGIDPAEWKDKYLYEDGLHPNAAGHKIIFEKVWAEVKKIIY